MSAFLNKILKKIKSDSNENNNISTGGVIIINSFNIYIDTIQDLLEIFTTKHICNMENEYLGIFELLEIIMYWVIDTMMDENYHNCQYIVFKKMMQNKNRKPKTTTKRKDEVEKTKLNFDKKDILCSHRRSASIGVMNTFSKIEDKDNVLPTMMNNNIIKLKKSNHDENKVITDDGGGGGGGGGATGCMIYDIDIIEIYNYTIGGTRSIESMVMHDIEVKFTSFLKSVSMTNKEDNNVFDDEYDSIFNEVISKDDKNVIDAIKMSNESKFDIFYSILRTTEVFSEMYIETLTMISMIKNLFQRQCQSDEIRMKYPISVYQTSLLPRSSHLNIKTNIKSYEDIIKLKKKFKKHTDTNNIYDEMDDDMIESSSPVDQIISGDEYSDDDDDDKNKNKNKNDKSSIIDDTKSMSHKHIESDERIIKLLELLHKDKIFIEDLSIHSVYWNIVDMYRKCPNRIVNEEKDDDEEKSDGGSNNVDLKRNSMDDSKKIKRDAMKIHIFPSSHSEHLSYRQKLQMKRQQHVTTSNGIVNDLDRILSNTSFMNIQLDRKEFNMRIKKRSVTHVIDSDKIDENTHSSILIHGFGSYVGTMNKLLKECKKHQTIMNMFFNENKTMTIMLGEMSNILFVLDLLNSTLSLK